MDTAFFGAADRDRTGMVSLPRDFKSLASANSTTAASAFTCLCPLHGDLAAPAKIVALAPCGRPAAKRSATSERLMIPCVLRRPETRAASGPSGVHRPAARKGRALFFTKKASPRDDAFRMEAPPGFEPGSQGFADLCLTTWLWRQKNSAESTFGAGNETRTRDIHLGKVTLYH